LTSKKQGRGLTDEDIALIGQASFNREIRYPKMSIA